MSDELAWGVVELATELRRERDEARALATQLAEALRGIADTGPPDYGDQWVHWREQARRALAVFDAKEKT